MECTGIKDLLSEYIDGGLDTQTREAIDEHLLTCETCNEEFISIKALVRELGSMEPVKAPDNFLEKLHERIAPRFSFEKVMRILFFPLRIKIPLELATASVVAILVFSILSIQHPERMISQAPESAIDAGVVKDTAMDGIDTAPKKEATKSQPILEAKRSRPQTKKREIIELALLIKGDVPGKAYKPGETPSRMSAAVKPRRIARLDRPAAPNAEMKRDADEREDQAMGSTARERSLRKEKPRHSLSGLFDTASKVKDLIGSVDGRVVSTKYETGTERPVSIHAEIPAKSYNAFCNKLKGIATLNASPPTISEKDLAPVQIHIRFISSE